MRGQGIITRNNKTEVATAPTVTAAANGLILNGTTVELGDAFPGAPLTRGTVIDQQAQNFRFTNFGNTTFILDAAASQYQMGDINSANNGTFLSVDDAGQAINFFEGGNSMLRLEGAVGNYRMGAIATGNQTLFDISDAAQLFQVASAGFSMLFLNMATGVFILGATAGGTANLSNFTINDTARTMVMMTNGNTMFACNDVAKTYQWGNVAIGNYLDIGTIAGTITGFGVIRTTAGFVNDDAVVFMRMTNPMPNGAGVGIGTLNTAPVAGNPTKWIGILDGATVRYIPAW